MKRISDLSAKLGLPEQSHERLKEALTHRTYAVEHGITYDNQRLEFLGDAVLEIIHTDYLFHLYPDLPEGDLTKIRSALACESMLAMLARKLNLGSFLLIGKGEQGAGGNDRDSTLADLFEAVLGAVYLEAGFVPSYKLFRQSGLQHLPVFEVELRVAHLVSVGSGGSRKLAEIAAAKLMCDYLKKH